MIVVGTFINKDENRMSPGKYISEQRRFCSRNCFACARTLPNSRRFQLLVDFSVIRLGPFGLKTGQQFDCPLGLETIQKDGLEKI